LGHFIINSLDLGRHDAKPADTQFVWAFISFTDPLTLAATIPGDVNFDGVVDIFDINLVSAHWNETGPAGDANADMMVDIFDINLVSANWTVGGGAAVPEPSSLALLLSAGLFALCLRRRGLRRRARGR
jgi:hypothetical protein